MIRRFVHLIILCALFFPCLPLSAEPIAPLAAPPLGERWFIITMGDERTGFAHTSIREISGGYEVSCESSVRMVVLGFSREFSARETYLVNGDLSLKSFVVEQTIGGNPMRLQGEVTAGGVKVTVDEAGKRREKTLKARGKVYPPPLLNLYPLMHGVKGGKKYRLRMLDPEEVKLKEVTVAVLGRETLPGGVATVHLRNDLYPVVDNDIWVDLAGNTVRESVRDGLIVTSAEEGGAVRRFLLDAAIAKKELILDFSLVRVDRPIARPSELKRMAVELSGLPENFPLPSGGGQQGERGSDGKVIFTVERFLPLPEGGVAAAASREHAKYPEPFGEMPPDSGELVAKKDEIAGVDNEPLKVAEKLARWIAVNVAESPADSLSPLETLKAKKGDCRSRVLLYVSLARSAGIPARLVSGLVHAAGKGFVYHSWAEIRVGEWLAVDPGLGQVPADATHIKLAEGDSPEDMAPLAGVVGRLKARIVEEKY